MVPRVLVLAAAGLVVAGCGAATKTSTPGGAKQPRSAGQLVGASGMVVAEHGTVRFCGGVAIPAGWSGSAGPYCPSGLLLRGVGLSRLSQRVHRAGATWGSAYLAGTFRDGTLTVVRQGPPRAAPNSAAAWRKPPCPAPAAGWPSSGPDSNPTVPHLANVLAVTIFRPRTGVAVVTVASSDPQQTRRSAGRSASDLCIVRSHYSAKELASTRTRLTKILTSGPPSARNDYITGVGSTSSPSGQPAVAVQALVDTPALDTLVHSAPHGDHRA